MRTIIVTGRSVRSTTAVRTIRTKMVRAAVPNISPRKSSCRILVPKAVSSDWHSCLLMVTIDLYTVHISVIARITGSLLQTLMTKKLYCTALSKVLEVLMLGFTIISTNLGDLRFPIITIYLSISTASTSQLYNQVAGAKSSSKPVTLSSHSGRCWPSGKYKPRWQALLYLMTTLLITHKLSL